jgi:small subunit ribosomal protein S5
MSKTKVQALKPSELELKEKLVDLRRVTKVTKGGRHFSFSATVVIGNGNGVVGHGLGKAKEVTDAIQKGIDDAKKNLITIPVLKGTIPHEQTGKFGAGKVLIKPATNGTGVIAGGAMRTVLESAGIHNVLAKSLGTSNANNVIKATFDALSKLKTPYQLSAIRGTNLDKIFNG